MFLASLFEAIGWFFADVGWVFWDIGVWFYEETPFSGVAYLFYDVVDFLDDIAQWFFRVAAEVEDWYDWIVGIWEDGVTVWNYAYGWLTNRANDAYTWAQQAITDAATALSKATDVFNYAYGWLTDLAQAAWDKALWVYDQIQPIVTAAVNDIYAWVRSIPAEIRDWVNNQVNNVKTWATGAIEDAKSSVLAQIAAPINLVNLWFDDIQDFFNDPAGWITGKLDQATDRLAQPLWNIIEKVLEKVW